MKYRCEYKYGRPFERAEHSYTIIGRHGALHLHMTDAGEDAPDRFSGGLEVHYRAPPSYQEDQAPHADKCWLLGCPCWHDGTSLYVSEMLIPMWRVAPNDHDRMFGILTREYERRFTPQADAA